jgi:hypothetical protein
VLKWYNVASGGSSSTFAPTPSTNIAGTAAFYVSQTSGLGCESPRAAISVITNAQPASPAISAAPYTKLFPGLTTSITAGTIAGTGNLFSWFRNDVLVTGQTANSISVNIDGLGSYKMKITNSLGCSNLSNAVTISDSTIGRMFVYPNPSTGKFQVRFQSDVNNLEPRKLTIYDSKGALVHSSSHVIFGAYTSIPVDLSNRTAGIYTIYLLDNSGNKLNTERVIIYK